MSIPVTQQPLLITAFDPFKDNQSHTHRSIADRLNISEQAALAALERLEGLSLLVCVRDGTDAPSGGAIRRPRRVPSSATRATDDPLEGENDGEQRRGVRAPLDFPLPRERLIRNIVRSDTLPTTTSTLVEEYDSADEVRQLIYSMEGQSRRSRRMLYSRRHRQR